MIRRDVTSGDLVACLLLALDSGCLAVHGVVDEQGLCRQWVNGLAVDEHRVPLEPSERVGSVRCRAAVDRDEPQHVVLLASIANHKARLPSSDLPGPGGGVSLVHS